MAFHTVRDSEGHETSARPDSGWDAARLRLVLQQLPAIVYTLDEQLTFTSSFGQALVPLGLKPNQVVGQPLAAFLGSTPRSVEVVQCHRRALRGECLTYEHAWGGRYFHVGLQPLREDGRIVGVVGAAHDFTDRRAAEHLLRDEAMQQLMVIRAAVEHVTDMVIITDAELDLPGPRIVYVNPAFERVTGYRLEDLAGQTPRVLQGQSTDRAVLDNLRHALKNGRTFSGETVNYRKDGRPYIVQWHIAAVRDAFGQTTHFVAIQRDVTAQRQQEEAARQRESELAHVTRLSTVGEMASGLAHELNQPLTAIANYAHGCLERQKNGRLDPDELTAVLQRIAQQAERSGEVIRRVRRFIRKREPQRELISAERLIAEARQLTEPEFVRYEAQLTVQCPADLPEVRVDSVQIEQVLLNLLRNALEAMDSVPPEQRQVRLTCRARDNQLELEVSDNGPVCEEAQLDRLFEPFFTTKRKGMGMGLNISQTLVEAHGGRLAVRPNPDRGLTFTIHLPVATSERRTTPDSA